MSQSESLQAAFRPFVHELTLALDASDEAAFRAAFEHLRARLNVELNPELRAITESAKSALVRFREELRLDVLAGQEVPDARKRLAHVVKLTDEAAHRTLDLVEASVPLVDATALGAAQLLLHSKSDAAAWPQHVNEFLEQARKDAELVRGQLSEMLLAQGYQDMTGQIIRGVMNLVTELETVLGRLVALANGEDTRRMPALKLPEASEDWRRGVGPQVEGVGTSNAVSAQDDIDALIASVSGNG